MQPSRLTDIGQSYVCDQCYRCKVKCSREQQSCTRCLQNNRSCTYSLRLWKGQPRNSLRRQSSPLGEEARSRHSRSWGQSYGGMMFPRPVIMLKRAELISRSDELHSLVKSTELGSHGSSDHDFQDPNTLIDELFEYRPIDEMNTSMFCLDQHFVGLNNDYSALDRRGNNSIQKEMEFSNAHSQTRKHHMWQIHESYPDHKAIQEHLTI